MQVSLILNVLTISSASALSWSYDIDNRLRTGFTDSIVAFSSFLILIYKRWESKGLVNAIKFQGGTRKEMLPFSLLLIKI